jgi:hypothetical protein
MSTPRWELDGRVAVLRLERFSARLSVGQPHRGLCDVRIATHALDEAELLGLAFPSSAQRDAGSSCECYRRGRDLIASYPESPSWPVCADVIWRAISPAETPGVVAGADLIVSVRTALLDSWPEVAVRSRLASAEIWRLANAETARFERCDGVAGPQGVLDGAAALCLFVFRPPDLPFSYAEMAHPADVQGTGLSPSREGPAIVETLYRLFAERVEKGGILRGRVRGVVVERARDLQDAAACYAAFTAADPPLGT